MSVRDCVLGSGIVPVVCPVGGQFGEPVLDPQIGGPDRDESPERAAWLR
jgi:hypothetical protein